MAGKLMIVGLGPGGIKHMTLRAKEAIKEAQVIIGYHRYIELIKPLIENKEIHRGKMKEEILRAKMAVELALEGKKVALVSGGDPGLYGMVAPVLEVLKTYGWLPGKPPELEIIPGVTAALAAAARLGAPLSTDTAFISLSDQLEPWEAIEKRLKAAAKAGFVIALYNPRSKKRVKPLVKAIEILKNTLSLHTPVGIAKNVFRENETLIITDLASLSNYIDTIDMATTVIVGREDTHVLGTFLLTPRGYGKKYFQPDAHLRINTTK